MCVCDVYDFVCVCDYVCDGVIHALSLHYPQRVSAILREPWQLMTVAEHSVTMATASVCASPVWAGLSVTGAGWVTGVSMTTVAGHATAQVTVTPSLETVFLCECERVYTYSYTYT